MQPSSPWFRDSFAAAVFVRRAAQSDAHARSLLAPLSFARIPTAPCSQEAPLGIALPYTRPCLARRAPMSTSAKKEVALAYAESRCGLLFQYKTRGLGRGVALSFLSCYPKEEEYLYPPMTYLQPENVSKDTVDNCVIVDVTPQMS